jgi:hypothetical protein
MNYQQIKQNISESVKTFTDAGIPRDFAEKLVSQFQVKHDAELKPVDGKPRKADLDRGDMLINVLPSGEVIAMMTDLVDAITAFFKDGSPIGEYIRLRYTPDGELKTSYHKSIRNALSGMTKQGPMFMLKHQGTRWSGMMRLDKPDAEDQDIERRTYGSDTISGEVGDVFSYMNKVFLPRMKSMLGRMVDEIYSNLRKLPKDLNMYGHRADVMNSQRAAALAAASAIEDIIDEGFTQSSLAEFLKTEGAKVSSSHYYATSWENLRDALRDFAEGDKLARAKWAKAFLDGARYHWQQVMDMVDAPVMKALQGESAELSEMISAGSVAAVAQPVGKMISRKPKHEDTDPSSKIYDRCWPGYRKVPGKKRGEKGSCEKISEDADITIGDRVRTLKMGQNEGTVVGFTNKRGFTQVMFKLDDGKVWASVPSNLEVLDSRTVSEEPKGLYYNVNKRKKAGTSRPKGHPKAPTDQAWKDAALTAKEDVDLDEGAREWVLGALMGMGLIGSVAGLSHLDRKAYANDPQLQQLITFYQEAKQEGDREAQRALKKRIETQKLRIDRGMGPVRDAQGQPIVPQRDRTTDARRTESLEETLHGDEFFEKYGWIEWPNQITEAEYQGRKVELNKPVRSTDGPKKFHVYVKNDKGNVIKVNFGDPDMKIRKNEPGARKSFRARHDCDNKKDKTTAGYWSCRKW